MINVWDFDGVEVPVQSWAVQDRIPTGHTTLFSGEGAVGKSLLTLHLLAAAALGRDWHGMLPEPGSAWYFGAEDDERELHISPRPMDSGKTAGCALGELALLNRR